MSEPSPLAVPSSRVERAIRFSYAQAMLSAVFSACVGGMFLIGYALRLGASNVQIGLLSTLPMYTVLMQLAASALVERGISRRKLTIIAALGWVLGYALVILIPYLGVRAFPAAKVAALIAAICLVTAFSHVLSNARSSWLGDLIPAHFRGTFFGHIRRYAGIIAVTFALLGGTVLDHLKDLGIGAFGWLFGFGILFGLAYALLFVPQPDMALARREPGAGFVQQAREALANKALRLMLVYVMLWTMQNIAAPFYPTYLLRDLRVPFLGVGAVSAVATLTMLASAPFWGRAVDRYGCRPVLVTCTAAIAPLSLAWIWITSALAAYLTVPVINFIGGFASAGISVASSTLLYKVTPSAGRSVQFAVYRMIVLIAVAPLPTLGGYLPNLLQAVGIYSDLRVTFYATVPIFLAAVWAATRLRESDSRATRELVRKLPRHLRKPREL